MVVGVGQGVLNPDLGVVPTTQGEGGLPMPPLKHLDWASVLPLLLPLPQHLEAPVLLLLLPLRVLLVPHHHQLYSGYQLHLELTVYSLH